MFQISLKVFAQELLQVVRKNNPFTVFSTADKVAQDLQLLPMGHAPEQALQVSAPAA